MQSAEIELKFPVADLAALQSRLHALGFRLDTPRTFEQNTLYDTPDRSLKASRQILRLRRYGSLWTVTHKRPDALADLAAENSGGQRYKVRIETETAVDDGPALGIVFEQLGYAPAFRYEKFRTEWSQAVSLEGLETGLRGHLVVDETPIGDFAELEGPPAWIDATLASLNINLASCITDSYGRLFLAWKERAGSRADHLTFDEIPSAELLQPTLG